MSDLQFITATQSELARWRHRYLQSLPQPQELFVEWCVQASAFSIIRQRGIDLGYLVWQNNEDARTMLHEFFLLPQALSHCEEIFQQCLDHFSIQGILCKSFDALLLKCCLSTGAQCEVVGTVFRDYVPAPATDVSAFQIRLAVEADIEWLLTFRDGLYESEDELRMLVGQRSMQLFSQNGVLVGCGFLIPVMEGLDVCDIGMWVNPPYRRQGIGRAIVGYLKQCCLERGYRPTAGCDVLNLASRRTLESNGFRSRYDLLLFQR